MLKLVFLSNFYNYHQDALSKSIANIIGEGYKFVETTPINEDRKEMGWDNGVLPEYVISFEEYRKNRSCVTDMVNNADVVIIGSAPISLVKERIKNKKLTFRYSERFLKSSKHYFTLPIRVLKYFYDGYRFMHLLTASAYAYGDYKKTFCFKNKAYKWGYFPEVRKYESIDKIIDSKQPKSILWVARFIDWKHPEKAISVAKKLKSEGYDFRLNMIGNGEMEKEIQDSIIKNNLQNEVTMLGAMPPEQVREYMEKSQIFLFTSDRNEGWGAVLNESMNSGCAVVASSEIGSVPFLIEDGKNGYKYKNEDDLLNKVKALLDSPDECERLGKCAYKTLTEMWNAEVAAERLISLSERLLNGKDDRIFTDGPCSKESN